MWTNLVPRPGEPAVAFAARVLLQLHAIVWFGLAMLMAMVSLLALAMSDPVSGEAKAASVNVQAILVAIGVPALLAALSEGFCRRLGPSRRWTWLATLILHVVLIAIYGWSASNLLDDPLLEPGVLFAYAFIVPLLLAALLGVELLVSPAVLRYAGVLGRRP